MLKSKVKILKISKPISKFRLKFHYTPLQLAACYGAHECLEIMVNNKTINIDKKEEQDGINAFWLAAYFGRGQCCSILANAGINILNAHANNGQNALHIAILRNHQKIVQ
jgi:ankyrin repeat protein